MIEGPQTLPRTPTLDLRALPDRALHPDEIPSTACVHELFVAQAARTPDAIAISCRGETVSYAALERRSGQLANALRRRGVGPEVRVGVCLSRTPELLVALLGVLRAGGAYVPLDPAYPRERLGYMVEDAGISLILTESRLADRLPAGIASLALDAGRAALDAECAEVGETGVLPENLSHVIFTSGSTGRPKGVMIRHSSVAVLMRWLRDNVSDEERAAVLFSTSINFDVSVAEMFGTLCWGGRLVLVENALELATVAEPVVHASMVPTAAAELLRTGGIPSTVRTLNLGGEALPNALAQGLYTLPGVEKVGNLYGPTEDTTYSTYSRVARGAERVLVGTPVTNTRAHVLDAHLRPVAAGEEGELYLAGDGLSRGYAARPGMTAERFLPDPFGPAGSRMYRVMDRVRWAANGELDYLGRTDFQVKIRGFRIELGEIEARLAEHADVQGAVVIAREDAPGDRKLVAYVVSRAVDAAALRAHLHERLPEYMVPAAYVRLDAFPLTPNGKLDRRALPAPEASAYAAAAYEAPTGATEALVAGIWAAVLGVERVGRRDDFFDLGGHSLLAMGVVSRVREALGAEIVPGDLFERAVLADFARALDAAVRTDAPAITPADRTAAIAPSFAQQRLWFLEQLGGTGAAYHIPVRLRLRGPLDRGALIRALDRIVARHEALRTTFPSVEGEPVQRIAPIDQSAFRLVEHDLRASPDAEDALRSLAIDEAAAPFDLAQGPLIRGRLVRIGADDHALLITMHHIVSDGWSTGVLQRELAALYGAFARGETDPLPPLPVQYADYAAWQRRWVADERVVRQVGYWERTLAGAPELLELPVDRTRPARQEFAGGSVAVEVDEGLTERLVALSRRHGVTLYMTVLAAWAAVLARLSGQRDVVIGTPAAGRGSSEIEGLIGFFVNTLALRVDLSAAPTVAELLRRVRERTLEAQRHQDIPFDQVVERVRPERSLAHTPVFQVMLAWQEMPGGTVDFPGLIASPLDGIEAPAAPFDLTLSLAPQDGRIAGEMSFATALFDRSTVERHVGYLRRVLEEMVADDRQPVDGLDLLSAAERRLVVEDCNATYRAYPAVTSAYDLFRAQASRTPEAVAISWRGQTLTYSELAAKANRLAHALRRRGIGPEVRVGICLPRTPETVAALLGVLAAGGAYVPLDPAYPCERLRYMVDDADIALIITDSGMIDRLPESAAALLVLDVEADAIAAEPAEAPAIDIHPENLSHLIFTSGSTGRPKGVMIRHSAVVTLLHWLREIVSDEERSALLFSTSISFDVSVAEYLGALCWGGKLVMVENALDLATVGEPVVYASMVPSAAAELLNSGGIPATVKTLNLAGEALPSALAQGLYALGTVEKVGNVYGPTEDTTYSTYSLVARGSGQVLIGTPASNSQAYVLDAHLQPVPVGVAGELYLAGAGVARGYANHPAMTAERFLPCPFGAPGGRMYRVMDRVRRHADGQLEYLGRTDFQVKVRGYRIELGEIEARLAEHPAVRAPIVLVREDVPGDRRLIAYYLAEEAIETDALRSHLAERLPAYMLPAAYVWTDSYPQTPNGKVDRKALPAPNSDASAGRDYEAPAGATEQALADIWSLVLGVARVGRRGHFFELGGHSLLAVRAISRVRQALGVDAQTGDLFTRPVLADFARALDAAERTASTAITPVDRTAPIPPSFAQQRLWFLEQLGGTGAAYHVPLRLRLRGALDRVALVRALERIVARHEALRTTFPAADGDPRQHIAPADQFRIHLHDHDLTGRDDAEDELRRLAAEEAEAPFDLARGPLVRGRLVRMGADEHALLLTMHHVVSDGWSLWVLERELSALYAAFSRGQADPLPPLPVQYADYAAWQRRRVEGAALEAQAEYWHTALSGGPELLELPTDRVRPARQDHAGAAVEVALDEALVTQLAALGRRHGATLYMTMLAAWAALLARLSGQDDVVVGTPVAGRGSSEIEGLIGFFVNTLAVRLDVSGAPTVADLLWRVRERALEAQRHQDVPFEQVVERVRPTRNRAHTPIFQVMLAWQSWQEMPGGGLDLAGIEATPFDVEEGAAQLDLTLNLAPRAGRVSGEVIYATSLFDRATVERYMGYLRRVLQGMVADDSISIDRLDLLDPTERRRVVEDWNATDRPYPSGACVHEMFAAQAARTPRATALTFRGETVSYAELEARANRLAHHLRRRGVGLEVRVGVCLPRTPEMIVALLGVLKAGGAYVPLDPTQPPTRLAAILEDAAISLVLTESHLAERFPASARAILLDCEQSALEAESTDAPWTGVTPENLSHVIFTSGSTGRPKGVMVRHAAVVALLHWMRETISDEERSSVLFSTSINFDVSVAEIFGCLCWGGRGVLVENALELASVQEPVTYVSMVPTAAAELLRSRGIPPTVRSVNLAGEALPPALVQGLYGLGTVEIVRNLYGPTEDTSYSTWSTVERGADRVVIGRALANSQAYVLDAQLQPVPVGVAGELYLAGAGLARGYAARPGLTVDRFLPCPFGPPCARMYRTGDRARWTTDGELEYLGRADFQVKIRGFRIELGEIEAQLRAHAAVRQAVVAARGDARGEMRLVAYHVGDATADTLQAHLAASLPAYMVPAAYVRLDELPLTTSGKLDRKALPAPGDAAFARRGDEPPRGTTEVALAEIWAEVLGVDRVGRRDHFFDLGGHSLLAVRLVERVREALAPAMALDDIFAYPTLEALAAWLDGKMEWLGSDHAIPVREGGLQRPLLVVHDMTGLVTYAQLLRPYLDPEIPIFALPGPLNSMAQVESMDDLIGRLVRMVAEVQPEGPYRLAGWSAGGIYAYALAQRLIDAGHTVELLAMIDTAHPERWPRRVSERARQFVVLDLLARDSAAPAATPEALRELKDATDGYDLPAFIAACHARGLLPETVTLARAEQVWHRIALLRRSSWEFEPRPIPVPICFISATGEEHDDPFHGWREMPGGGPIRLESVPGTHITMWRRGNVEILGDALSRAIREAAVAG